MQLIFQETEKLLPSIVGKDITLRVSISAEELLINGDATQIEQILLNLASNARDAMPLGGALSV